MPFLLLLAVLVIATCGLVYELVAGTLASYLLGDSVTQFSTIIGTYLFAMGIGSWLSKFIKGNIYVWFIQIEVLVGLIGGFSATILFFSFGIHTYFRLVLYGTVVLTGIFVGLEIPLLMRLLKKKYSFDELVSRVLSVDYIGALVASIAFPLFFVPNMGLIRTSLFFGILNVGVAVVLAFYIKEEIKNAARFLQFISISALIVLVLGFVWGEKLSKISEQMHYNEKILFSKTTQYQKIVITRNKNELKLHLNNNLQFSSADEYRYHEALVHPAFMYAKKCANVLIMGGGDGLAAREVLKYPEVEHVTLVELDPYMIELFTQNPTLNHLNKNSLSNPRMHVKNQDALVWLQQNETKFDIVIIDFPDPGNFAVGKLYSTTFYHLLKNAIDEESIVVVQSTSPYVAPKSYKCVQNTLEAEGYLVLPYHVYVPSFGDWGYIMASMTPLQPVQRKLPQDLKFFGLPAFQSMMYFPKDMLADNHDINRLNNQALVEIFEHEWAKYTGQ
jgi:spermidine synthase